MDGSIIGNYQLERELGRGGMGVVYAARHRVLGHSAAIKLLLANEPDRVQRFFNEGRAAMAIAHPGVVKLFDVGINSDGRAYLAMELLTGRTLRSKLANGPLPVRVAIDYARQIATALVAAHAANVIHRDLKPDNIFIDGSNQLKLVDFGIAKMPVTNVRTATGALLGTPPYMSPEQCEGLRELDPRSDLYSLGCVMFAMLSGRPPFEAGGVGGIIASQIKDPPPPLLSVCPGASPALAEVVHCLLAKSRDDRFRDANAFLVALGNPAVSVLSGGHAAVTADAVPSIGGTQTSLPGQRTQLSLPDASPHVAGAPLGQHGGQHSGQHGARLGENTQRSLPDASPRGAHPGQGTQPSVSDQRMGAPSRGQLAPVHQLGLQTTYPDHRQLHAQPPPSSERRRTMLIAALVGVAAIAALIAVLATKSCGSSTVIVVQATPDAREERREDAGAVASIDARVADPDSTLDVASLFDAGTKQGTPNKRNPPPKDAGVTVAKVAPDAAVEVKTRELPPDAAPPEPPKPPPAIERRLEFADKDFSLPPGSDAVIAELERLAAAHPQLRIVIEGDAGLDETNRPDNLAAARANKVMMAFRNVDRSRISVSARASGGRSVRITTR